MKKILRKTLLIATLLTTLSATAHDFEVGGIYYNITDATAQTVVVTFSGASSSALENEYSGAVSIPETVTYSDTTYDVTSIGVDAFSNCTSLTSVIIPNSVTSIGNYAFCFCTGLTSVTIPNSVTSIGEGAFSNCTGLTSVTIPNSVTSIDKYAFFSCSGLTSVTIPNSVTSIGDGAFSNCIGLTSGIIGNSVTSIGNSAFYYCIGLTSVIIPNSVTSIGEEAFSNCTGLTSVIIGNSVTSIGYAAFSFCSCLISVTIPNSVTEIGQSTFRGCAELISIVVKGGNKVYDSRDNCNAIIETATNTLIQGCNNSTIPNSVTSVGKFAFSDCTGMTSVTIPNSVTSIGFYAFARCTGLTSVIIPNSVTEIGSSAFDDCSGLTSVTIGNSVTSILNGAFWRCTGLTSFKSLNPTPPSCGGSYVFNSIPTDCILYVPAGSKEAYANDTYWSYFTNIVEIATVEVETESNTATFDIPTTDGAVSYVVNVYADEAMTQLVATSQYDAEGKIIPSSTATSLELSVEDLEIGVYYYEVTAADATGSTLASYSGSFEISETSAINNIESGSDLVEVARYDVHGRLLSEPTPGINIVIYSDSTPRKVIVK